MQNEKNVFWKSGTISALSLILFVTVLLIILAGNIYMNICIENEATAQKNRYELKALGESLADASDYLTDEVRKYAVTGEIEHLYNYWYEVEVTKRRDNAIDTLISYNPPQKELYLLKEAKKYSDILIETEAYSMKMVLLANQKTVADYAYDKLTQDFVKRVMSYELPEKYKTLSAAEMKEVSISILYDENYENAKYLIMNPIETFQNEMNARLNRDVAESTNGRVKASTIQITCLLTGIIFIGILLFGLNNLYILPLKEYTEDLNKAHNQDAYGKFDLSMVQVAPKGAYELRQFGQLFNGLSKTLQSEFEKREKAEEEMRIARDEATRANNAKSDFLARMSHELRTPLNAIIGYLYLLNESISDERQKRYCESIRLSSENLLGLISDILDFAKIESGKMTFENVDFDMISLIREVCSIMENSARQKRLAFRLEIEGDMPKIVRGDVVKLRQLLINLVGNAVKFTHEGFVKLSVKVVENTHGFCLIEFAVSDTGIGVRQEDKQKIFEPFVQSDASITRKYGGTGLGLAICRMIVEGASGGKETIELDSEEGKGSCFKFRMKFGIGDEKALSIDSNEEFLSAGIGKKVLLVDDNEINLEVESEIIKAFGIMTETAQSGEEALKKVFETKFDMIIMDIRMPDMDGYEVTSRIRKMREYKFTPIIALSADAVAGVAEKALEAGVNCYVSKPLKPEKLRAIMSEYFSIAQKEPEKLDTGAGGYFNFRKCLKNINGNEALLVRLAKKFAKERANDAEHISLHIKDKNFGNARHILHDIAGLSGNLCCDELCASAKKLGEQLKGNTFSSLDEFLEIWEKTMQEINDYILSKSSNDFKNVKSGDFQKILNDFASKCSAYDVEAAEIFEANKSFFKDFFTPGEYEKLRTAVAGYDFEAAAKILLSRGE